MRLADARSEMSELQSTLGSTNTENIDEVRRKLAEKSIQLEE